MPGRRVPWATVPQSPGEHAHLSSPTSEWYAEGALWVLLAPLPAGAFSSCFWACRAPAIARPVLALRVCVVHLSDYSRGFGGKYGVQKDRMDKVSF